VDDVDAVTLPSRRRSPVAAVLLGATLVATVSVGDVGSAAPTTGSSSNWTGVPSDDHHEVHIDGRLSRLVAVSADREMLSDVLVVDTGEGAVPLVDPDEDLAGLPIGTSVSVSGVASADGSVIVDDVSTVESSDPGGHGRHEHDRSSSSTRALSGTRSLLVVPVRGSVQVAVDPTALAGPMDRYVEWVGQRVNGDLTVEVSTAQPVTTPTVACASSGGSETAALLSGVRSQGVDPDAYDFITFVLVGDVLADGCYAAGWALEPGRLSWYDFEFGWHEMVIAHEIGHNWGLSHAGRTECGTGDTAVQMPLDGPRAAGCTWREYGDPYSVMGSGRWVMGHEQHQLGWYGTSSPYVANGTHQFTLGGPDATSGRRVLALRAANRAHYWVEFAPSLTIATGYTDQVVYGPSTPGVSIRWRRPPRLDWLLFGSSTAGYPYLVDAVPDSQPDFTEPNDSMFLAGQTFSDPHGTVSVRVDAVTQTSATVTVTVTTPYVLPSSPTSAYPAEADGRVLWVFALPVDNGDGTFRGYTVSARPRRANGSWGAWTTSAVQPARVAWNGLTASVGGMTNGIVHQTRLCPVSSLGVGSCVSGTVSPFGKAPQPPRPRVVSDPGLCLRIRVPNTGGPGISATHVQRRIASGRWRTVARVDGMASCPAVRLGSRTQPVQFRFRVVNSFGASPWSDPSAKVRSRSL
jgi:hypothetical protein